MAQADELYADVLSELKTSGYDATITQTGGMCLAIAISLDDGRTILVTDKDDILPWERESHSGWGIGLYTDVNDAAPIQFVSVDDGSPSALVGALVALRSPTE
jgi:hypothetical protein